MKAFKILGPQGRELPPWGCGSGKTMALFELRDHAMVIARNEACGLWGDFGFDEDRQCWWASDSRGRQYQFVVEEVAVADAAA
jgi:hypothetical protein